MNERAGSLFTLRPATEQDQAAIRSMVRQARLNPTGLDWQRFTVAVSPDGQVIGCIQVKPHKGNLRELASLVVQKPWRGSGIARTLIENTLKQEEGALYLMCRASLIPFYNRFHFKALQPAEMPPYFLRMHNLFHLARRVIHSRDHLAIMLWDGPGPAQANNGV